MSKKQSKPEQVTTLEQLAELVKDRKSVYLPNGPAGYYGRNRPSMAAAWALNMNGSILLRLFRAGLYVYEPKSSRRGASKRCHK